MAIINSTTFSDVGSLLQNPDVGIMNSAAKIIVPVAIKGGADAITFPTGAGATVYWKKVPGKYTVADLGIGIDYYVNKSIPETALIAHELQHVIQIRGFFNKQSRLDKALIPGCNFLVAYLNEYNSMGKKLSDQQAYENISFEIEGHAVQTALETLLSNKAFRDKFNNLYIKVNGAGMRNKPLSLGEIQNSPDAKALFDDFKTEFDKVFSSQIAARNKLLGK